MPSRPRLGRSGGRRTIARQPFVQVDPERVIENVRCDHEAAERGKRHDLGRGEFAGERRVEFVADAAWIAGELAPIGDQEALTLA